MDRQVINWRRLKKYGEERSVLTTVLGLDTSLEETDYYTKWLKGLGKRRTQSKTIWSRRKTLGLNEQATEMDSQIRRLSGRTIITGMFVFDHFFFSIIIWEVSRFGRKKCFIDCNVSRQVCLLIMRTSGTAVLWYAVLQYEHLSIFLVSQ